MTLWERLWAEIERPDSTGSPSRAYIRCVLAIAHAMLGASAAGIYDLWGLGAATIGACIYWLWKERGDLQRGGTVWDGLEDTVFVALGFWYGSAWWPALMMLCGGYVFAVATVRGWGQ